jgi:hypothetical protein
MLMNEEIDKRKRENMSQVRAEGTTRQLRAQQGQQQQCRCQELSREF